MAMESTSYVREVMAEDQPAPVTSTGIIGWMRQNLFSNWFNTILTLIAAYILWQIIPPLLDFALFSAVWTGSDRTACATEQQGGVKPNAWFGACWAYVDAYFWQFIYGRYPVEERWRVDLSAVLFFGGLIPVLIPKVPYKRENIVYMTIVAPIAIFILLTGGHLQYGPFLGFGSGAIGFWVNYIVFALVLAGLAAGWAHVTKGDKQKSAVMTLIGMAILGALLFILSIDFGLEHVETEVWGGLLVTLVIAITGIAASLPLGIALALGRRSNMPFVRMISVIFIEFWRGVPLISVLFMSSVMLPLFLPEGVTFDKLLRALIGVSLFSAAYMAEVVRGGLQAIPKGQYEGAMALGLSYWQMMQKIILPQALKLVIPGIVNTFIGLFKDTTLVLIIGLFDFLGQIQSSFTDASWSTPVQSLSGYFFACIVYWFFCFSMSRYSIFMENRLHTGHKR